MGPPGELGLALDVDQALRSQSHRRGHPRGPAERVIAQVDHRQPVDLPDLAPLHIDQQRAFFDQLANLLGDAVGPVDAVLQRLLDVERLHELGVLVAREVVRLADQVRRLREMGQQLGLVAHFPGAEPDDLPDGFPREGVQVLVPHGRGDKAGVLHLLLLAPGHLGAEIGLDLEHETELLVVEPQHVIEQGIADHDDLGIDRDRLGAQLPDAEGNPRVDALDLHAAALERALEAFVDERLGQARPRY